MIINMKSAFTLIELLITVSLITIATAAIVPAFTGFLQGQNLPAAKIQLKSDLRNVVNKALTGSYSDQYLGPKQVKYWGVKWRNATSEYCYFIDSQNTVCLDAGLPAKDCRSTFHSFPSQHMTVLNLPSGVIFNSNTGCVFFNISDGSSSCAGAGCTIQIKDTSTMKTDTVHIKSDGLVTN